LFYVTFASFADELTQKREQENNALFLNLKGFVKNWKQEKTRWESEPVILNISRVQGYRKLPRGKKLLTKERCGLKASSITLYSSVYQPNLLSTLSY